MKFLGAISLTILLISCQHGIEFNPDFYIGDYENVSITNEDGKTVYADEPLFNKYACMHEEKVKELKKILSEATISRKAKRKLDFEFTQLIGRMGD